MLVARSERDKANRDANRRWIYAYLLEHPCVECGETDPRLLEFDHLDVDRKRRSVSHLVAKNYSLRSVIEEMAKCRVRGVRCHRRHTFTQLGWNFGGALA